MVVPVCAGALLGAFLVKVFNKKKPSDIKPATIVRYPQKRRTLRVTPEVVYTRRPRKQPVVAKVVVLPEPPVASILADIAFPETTDLWYTMITEK